MHSHRAVQVVSFGGCLRRHAVGMRRGLAQNAASLMEAKKAMLSDANDAAFTWATGLGHNSYMMAVSCSGLTSADSYQPEKGFLQLPRLFHRVQQEIASFDADSRR